MSKIVGVPSSQSFGSSKKYVRWGGERGRSLKSEQKQTGGGGVLACMYVRFKKKCWDFQNEVYSYSAGFPTDYNGSMKYHHERL